MCKPYKAECNPKIERMRPNQRRYLIDTPQDLALEESTADIRKEVDKLECDKPDCDCHS